MNVPSSGMGKARNKSSPRFFWQGVLIVLPVLVLAGFGFVSLRQDKALGRSEANERAQSIAETLLPRLWMALTQEPYPRPSFQVDAAGNLVFPPPLAPWPAPQPFNLAALNRQQLQAWEAAQKAERQNELGTAAGDYEKFLELEPPEQFAAAACYSLGLLRQGRAAADMFNRIVTTYPNARGESGLPMLPLAEFKLLELGTNRTDATAAVSLDSFCSNIVTHPTPLTPALLSGAMALARNTARVSEVEAWERLWDDHELARALYAAASVHFGTELLPFASLDGHATASGPAVIPALRQDNWKVTATFRPGSLAVPSNSGNPSDKVAPRLFWFTMAETSTNIVNNLSLITNGLAGFMGQAPEPLWLAVRSQDALNGCWFICRTMSEVRNDLAQVADRALQIPEYFGLGFEVAGKKFPRSPWDLVMWTEHHYGGKGGGWDKQYSEEAASESQLAGSAARIEGGRELLRASVYLTSPDTLFSRQRARTFWFGSLIAVSAIVALLGLAAAWRAYHQQQKLGEIKSNFVSSVSHELRAPIASVRLLAEGLAGGKVTEPEKQHEYFRFIIQECRRLSSLVENVLDFSRIEQGRKEYEFEPTDLVTLTRETAKLMEPNAVERCVQIHLDLPEREQMPSPVAEVAQPRVDGKAIQQALVNLLDNAIKHSPKGGTVKVGLELPIAGANNRPEANEQSSAAAAQVVRLWVEDQGEGIPPEEQQKIFERFYRRGSELRRETRGIGIGLSIVKHIVEAHQGRVIVRSAVGQGSRFTIELPFTPGLCSTETAAS